MLAVNRPTNQRIIHFKHFVKALLEVNDVQGIKSKALLEGQSPYKPFHQLIVIISF